MIRMSGMPTFELTSILMFGSHCSLIGLKNRVIGTEEGLIDETCQDAPKKQEEQRNVPSVSDEVAARPAASREGVSQDRYIEEGIAVTIMFKFVKKGSKKRS